MAAASGIVRLEHFGLDFGNKTILRDVSLTVPDSGCTVLLGPSGTGKSTLLRTLAGMTQSHPDLRVRGVLQVGTQTGLPLQPPLPALVEQKARMLIATVRENLLSELAQRSSINQIEQRNWLESTLSRWGQADLLDALAQPVIDLPVPRQRIVNILRKAMGKPPLLLVDEPTANLPADQAEPIVALLQALKRDMPLLLISHHLGHTRALADHIILLASGRVQESTPAAQFFEQPQSESGQHFLRTGSCPEMVEKESEDTAPAPPEAPPAAAASAPTTKSPPAPPPARAVLQKGPRGFVWLFPGHVAGTPWPGIVNEEDADLSALQAAGITCLYSLTDRPFDPERAAPYGMMCLCSSIPDMGAPSMAQALEVCHHIDQLLHAKQCIALHCKAGLGRTGTLLAVYLLWRRSESLSAAAAIAHIRALNPLMIQSAVQEQFLVLFAQHLAVLRATPQESGA